MPESRILESQLVSSPRSVFSVCHSWNRGEETQEVEQMTLFLGALTGLLQGGSECFFMSQQGFECCRLQALGQALLMGSA